MKWLIILKPLDLDSAPFNCDSISLLNIGQFICILAAEMQTQFKPTFLCRISLGSWSYSNCCISSMADNLDLKALSLKKWFLCKN
jgi:hypothetical protein